MPSQLSSGNSVLLEYHNKEEESGAEESFDSNNEIKEGFFQLPTTEGYFPSLKLTEDYLPVGDARPKCIHLDWIRLNQKRQTDKFNQVQNFPTCEGAENKRVRW